MKTSCRWALIAACIAYLPSAVLANCINLLLTRPMAAEHFSQTFGSVYPNLSEKLAASSRRGEIMRELRAELNSEPPGSDEARFRDSLLGLLDSVERALKTNRAAAGDHDFFSAEIRTVRPPVPGQVGKDDQLRIRFERALGHFASGRADTLIGALDFEQLPE